MWRAWLIKLLAVLVLGISHTAWAAVTTPVGRVAMAVGDAKRITADGNTAPLRSGVNVLEGDRIITGGDAVAIIVFVDSGRISLRSDSELLVKQYKADPAGVNSQLEFELLRGSIRQISGQAARMQPERYRLNTPIASIGVRGTDFLAKTLDDTLETFVQEGKIVVFSGAAVCADSAQTGACAPLADMAATDAARYLKMFAGGRIERRAVASDEIERVFGISIVKAVARNGTVIAMADPAASAIAGGGLGAPSQRDVSTPGLDNDKSLIIPPPKLGDIVATLPVVPTSPVTPPVVVVPPVTNPPPPTDSGTPPVIPPVTVDPPPVVVPPVTPPTPVLVLHNAPDLTRQLVWGSFDRADKLPLQLLATNAQAQDGRIVTVGDLGQFALWRSGASQPLSGNLKGEAKFDIHAGEAFLQQGTAKLPVAISNPSLSVDFDNARFATSLTLTQAQTGDVLLQAAGKMDDEGRFLSVTDSQRVAGAITTDGKEAGYWFTRDHALGVFKGVTLWNVR